LYDTLYITKIEFFRHLKRVVFTALHGMQMRSSDENSVCLSVCLSVRPSVTRVNGDKTVERSVQIFLYHTKDHLA